MNLKTPYDVFNLTRQSKYEKIGQSINFFSKVNDINLYPEENLNCRTGISWSENIRNMNFRMYFV